MVLALVPALVSGPQVDRLQKPIAGSAAWFRPSIFALLFGGDRVSGRSRQAGKAFRQGFTFRIEQGRDAGAGNRIDRLRDRHGAGQSRRHARRSLRNYHCRADGCRHSL
jgi:hypothetical protein